MRRMRMEAHLPSPRAFLRIAQLLSFSRFSLLLRSTGCVVGVLAFSTPFLPPFLLGIHLASARSRNLIPHCNVLSFYLTPPLHCIIHDNCQLSCNARDFHCSEDFLRGKLPF